MPNLTMTMMESAADMSAMPVKVIRSERRIKSYAARVEDGVLVVRIPAYFDDIQERDAVADMRTKLAKRMSKARLSDEDLNARAEELNKQYLEGKARLGSIRWVTNQNHRWGSCTLSTGDIRITHRLQEVPGYVLDSVIIHELVHTFVSGHSKQFWEWADRAPQAERAKGFLEGLSFGTRREQG